MRLLSPGPAHRHPLLGGVVVPRARRPASNPMLPASTKKQREACSMWSRTRSRGAVPRSSTRCSTLIRRQVATQTTSADRLLRAISKRGALTLEWILDTHPHMHRPQLPAISSKDMTGAPTAIGDRVTEVQKIWKMAYHLPGDLPDRRVRNGIICLRTENESPLARLRRAHCYPWPHVVLHDLRHRRRGPLCTTLCSCRKKIRERRAPIFPEATRFEIWRSIQRILQVARRHARCLPAMTIVQAVGKRAGKAPSLSRRRTNFHLKDHDEKLVRQISQRAGSQYLPLPNLMLSALQVNIAGGRTAASRKRISSRYLSKSHLMLFLWYQSVRLPRLPRRL